MDKHVCKTVGIAPEKVTTCSRCSDSVQLMKDKIRVSPKTERVKVLTMASPSWSINKTKDEFGVTAYMVRQARKLKNERGILSDPSSKCGKMPDRDTIKKVQGFYRAMYFLYEQQHPSTLHCNLLQHSQ